VKINYYLCEKYFIDTRIILKNIIIMIAISYYYFIKVFDNVVELT